ncbi:TIGR02444 family protein [Phenylobacterium sp. VNQ135]|uniref:TIGR02444 family protein n=1 Tax=Phenylobacterium sp. VNQ135 TaxID=3400922 RepID=UPI003C0CBD56
MDIWDWALEAYAQPGAPEACLSLQDEHGQNTPLLLWAVWAEASDPGLLARAADCARSWDEVAVTPLRRIRRTLKPSHPPVADAAREALREEVKAAELRAERVLLETLAGLGPSGGGASTLEALEGASRAWGPPAPREALAVLAAALG